MRKLKHGAPDLLTAYEVSNGSVYVVQDTVPVSSMSGDAVRIYFTIHCIGYSEKWYTYQAHGELNWLLEALAKGDLVEQDCL